MSTKSLIAQNTFFLPTNIYHTKYFFEYICIFNFHENSSLRGSYSFSKRKVWIYTMDALLSYIENMPNLQLIYYEKAKYVK